VPGICAPGALARGAGAAFLKLEMDEAEPVDGLVKRNLLIRCAPMTVLR
jgi:hypothetical protein